MLPTIDSLKLSMKGSFRVGVDTGENGIRILLSARMVPPVTTTG